MLGAYWRFKKEDIDQRIEEQRYKEPLIKSE